jgi:lactobin A/cerein 7B family class IIb bacteriocin
MNTKFNSISGQALSENEMQEIQGGIILLFFAAVTAAEFALMGAALKAAYEAGYRSACGC